MFRSYIFKELETTVGESFTKLSDDEKNEFYSTYIFKRKKLIWMYVWWILGFHYLYVGEVSTFFKYFLTLGGFFIWWLIDMYRLVTILNRYNKKVALALLEAKQKG